LLGDPFEASSERRGNRRYGKPELVDLFGRQLEAALKELVFVLIYLEAERDEKFSDCVTSH
jgi:hypothetical protein